MEEVLKELEAYYPKVRNWYENKVIGDTNRLVKIVTDSATGETKGLLILKKYFNDRKISTLFVVKKYRGRGIGRDLLMLSIEEFKREAFYVDIHKDVMSEYVALMENHGLIKAPITENRYHWMG